MLLFAGIALLLAGGAALVRGASGLAASLGVSPLIIGLTVVAFGTSAPELVVNLIGVATDETQLAFGNVAGSNLANLGLILGCAALVRPIEIKGQLVRREIPLLLLATAVLLVHALDGPLRGEEARIDRADGLVLLLLFTVFVYIAVIDIIRSRRDPVLNSVETLSERVPESHAMLDSSLVFGGALGLALGGYLTIEHGAALAEAAGLPRVVVGIAIIAVGTSLPELVTCIMAAIQREADLCVGNVVGSNLFNGLLVLPSSAVLAPLVVPAGGVIDVSASFLLAAVLIPVFFLGHARLGRVMGTLLVATYFAYLGWSIFLR